MILNVSETECFFEGISFANHDLLQGAVMTYNPEDCQRKCQQRDKCRFWTFSGLTRLCYLKGESFQWQTNDIQIGILKKKVSGTRDCPGCYKKTRNIKYEEDVGWMPSVRKCQESCQQRAWCAGFYQGVGQTSSCYLTSTEEGKHSIDDSHFITGPKSCSK